jgi:hypothetical protein
VDEGLDLLRVPGGSTCRERRPGRLLGRVFALSLGFERLAQDGLHIRPDRETPRRCRPLHAPVRLRLDVDGEKGAPLAGC